MGRRQLRSLGLTREAVRHLLRQGVLTPVHRDVFVVAATPDAFHRRVWCALLAAGPEAVASHRLAGRLHRMRGFAAEGIDVLVHERVHHSRVHHSRVHGALHTTSWLPKEHVTSLDGLPVTTFGRTLFDLAGLSSPKRLRAGRPYVHTKRVARALDTAMGDGMAITDVARVLATMGKRGRPGTVLMRELVEARAGGYEPTDSELEDLVVSVLSAYDLPLPEPQRHLGGDRLIGRVDFAYRHPRRLVVEADGRPYHRSLSDRDSDRWRDTELVAAGWPVIRVTWRDLTQEPERFAAAVARTLGVRMPPEAASRTPGPSKSVRKRGR